MQGSFSVWTEHKKHIRDIRFKPMLRHVFLYDNSVLFCKKKDDPHNIVDKVSYQFKSSLKVTSKHLVSLIDS